MFDKKRRAMERVEKYQRVFSGVDGEWVLNDLMEAHHIMRPMADKTGHVDPTKEGERMAVLRILTILDVNIAQLRERMQSDEL